MAWVRVLDTIKAGGRKRRPGAKLEMDDDLAAELEAKGLVGIVTDAASGTVPEGGAVSRASASPDPVKGGGAGKGAGGKTAPKAKAATSPEAKPGKE